ncbi:DUF1254 domain-containing protein [Haladaptatus sp. NG-WS-4]
MGVNRLYYPNEGRPITADFTAVVSPNATTLYGQGFLDLQDEPIVIEMPEVTDRYFSLELMDQYGIYPLYAGNQFNGTDARSYLVLPDGYEGEIPGDFAATDVVQAGTKTLFTEVRYALAGIVDRHFPCAEEFHDLLEFLWRRSLSEAFHRRSSVAVNTFS